MNIKELKEYIKDLPDDMLVIHRGYENGYDESCGAKVIKVKKNIRSEWYDGKYIEEKQKEKHGNYGPTISVLKI